MPISKISAVASTYEFMPHLVSLKTIGVYLIKRNASSCMKNKMLEVHVAEKCKKKDRLKSLLHHLSSNKQREIVRNLLSAHLYPHLLGTLKSIKHLEKKTTGWAQRSE